jgi:hypothetical protein
VPSPAAPPPVIFGPPAPDREALLMGCLAIRPPYQKYDVAVRRSPIDGFGVFALEPVPRWQKIGEVRASPSPWPRPGAAPPRWHAS